MPSVLITFVPHPSEVVRPGSHPPVLTTIPRRAELVAQLGVDVFCALPFTLEFSRLPPDEFVHRVLVERLHASGRDRGRELPVRAQGRRRRRAAAAARPDLRLPRRGRRAAARRAAPSSARPTCAPACRPATSRPPPSALGRPHRVDGVVERGDQRGRELGLPDGEPAHRRVGGGARPTASTPATSCGWTRPGAPSTAPPLGVGAISVGTNPDLRRAPAPGRGLHPRLRRRPVRRRARGRVHPPAARAWSASTRSTSSSSRWQRDVDAHPRARPG